jgi:lipoate-protein ligase A
MAIDEAILAHVVDGRSRPTLRFYAWSPPCLSLGRSQSLADVDLVACRSAGVDIVRRPTGGRAILHTDELTYSVTLLQDDPRASGDVVDSYRRISEGLLAGLHLLDVEAVQAVGKSSPEADQTPVCFETPSAYEITVQGKKLVGSAQWRGRGGVLQHGTLPLCGDLTRILDYLAQCADEREAQARTLRQRVITLASAAGRTLLYDQVAQTLADGFSRALGLSLVLDKLSPSERDLAADIRCDRYAAPDWTARRP